MCEPSQTVADTLLSFLQRLPIAVRHDDQTQPRAGKHQIWQIENAFPLFRPQIAAGEQSTKLCPSLLVLRIGNDIGAAVLKDHPGPDDQFELPGSFFDLGRCKRHIEILIVLDQHIFSRPRSFAQLFDRQDALPKILKRCKGPNDPGDRVAIGDANSRVAEQKRGENHVLRMRGAAQKGEICGGGQLGIKAHENTPCKNHCTASASRP